MVDSLERRLGAAIKVIRTERRLTQAELAAKAGLDLRYLGSIERGMGNPTVRVLQKIADALGVDAASLITS